MPKKCSYGHILDTRKIKAIVFGKQEEFVYDLCVENNHNYTIGQDRYLVHNSGKSVFMAQKVMLDLMKGDRWLVCRKVYKTLRYSCYLEIKTAIINAGLKNYFTFNLAPDLLITYKPTGAFALFKGLDDIENVKSISGLTKIWIEEASEVEENDIDQLDLRLRGSDDIIFQTFLSFNPISENHWIKKKYFDKSLPDVFILKTTYLDNKFVGSAYAKKLNVLAITNPTYYNIYALGEWGKIQTGNEFYHRFSNANIGANSYNPNLPIHISFDFNVLPYCTALLTQVEKVNGVYELRIIKEYCLPHPSNTRTICNRVVAEYPDCRSIYYYGDPAGSHRDTRSGHTDYTIIKEALAPLNPVSMVASSAPSLVYRAIFANNILADANPNIKLSINPDCKNLIKDLQEVRQDADGSKQKTKVKDKETGQTYEALGHTSDAFDYLICRMFESEFRNVLGKKGGISAGS